MANSYKVLAQNDLPATTLTAVYTVPSATETVISTIVIANRTASAADVLDMYASAVDISVNIFGTEIS
jgi:hypothetical protein